MTSAGTVFLAVDDATSTLTDDDRHLASALERRGAAAVPLRWGHDVPAGATIVIRSTWDYVERPARFARWLAHLVARDATIHNPVGLLRWNIHKRYLTALARRGVPIVPTRVVAAGARCDVAALRAEMSWDDIVVKPAIGGSARLAMHSRQGGMHAVQRHLDRLTRQEDALVQPFLDSIATSGEISVVAIAGAPCLAVEKRPAAGDWRVHAEFGGTAAPAPLTEALVRIARAALDVLDETPTYARVDVTGDPSGHQVLELELIEPELFFRLDPTLADRLARQILDGAAGTT